VTVLALLLSLLLGYAPAAASAVHADRGAPGLGKADANKSGAVVRAGGRLQSDDREEDELLGASPARPVTQSLSQRPATTCASADVAGVSLPAVRRYRARAPPAA
jgi:hypothetical protein